jgi:hypothetical protein
MTTFTHTYEDAQENIAIITPVAGKKLQISRAFMKVDENGMMTFNGKLLIILTGKGEGSLSGIAEGNVNDKVFLTCGSNTQVEVTYNEV